VFKKVIVTVIVAVLVLSVAPAAFAQEPTTVNVWVAFDDYRLDWANDVASAFNEAHPQYNVVITGGHSYETMFAEATVAGEQGDLPAAVHFFEAGTQDARDSGLFKPVEEAIAGRTEIDGVPVPTDFLGVVGAYYTLDGVFTSFPWNTSSAIWFNNMTILNAAGVMDPPATWADVEAACDKIMAMDTAPEYCFTWPNHGWFFEQWLAQQDGLFVNNGNGRDARATEVAFNSDAGVAILTWLDDMYNKGYLFYSGAQGGDSWSTVDTAYSTQEVAMAAYSSSDTTLYTQYGVDGGFETVTSFLPYNDDTGWTGNLIGGGTLWLTDGLDPAVEDGALAFLSFVDNPENAASWHQLTGYMAVTQSGNDLLASEGWFEENPNQTTASDQLAQSTITPATSGALVGGFPAIRTEITGAIDRVLLTDDDPAAVLADAADAANTIIEEYNLLNAD
jgi:sn-glycerol 3-phosphate transport system substrate-binding protein